VTYLDQMFAGDVKGLANVLRLTTGVRSYNVNPEAIIAMQDKEKKRELIDMLSTRANLKEFTRAYVPK
jgi:hypothetical protein